jgi:L-amino acid N-acyltransferase YncA
VLAATRRALEIRALRAADWPRVAEIYAEGIATRNATFETEVSSWEEWDAAHLPAHRLVAGVDGEVVGWAALSPTSRRPCYAGVVEDSVYVTEEARGQGVGSSLLRALAEGAEKAGFWTIQTSIFPENETSIALHRQCGFRVVGIRMAIGQLDGVWRDTVLMERRVA